MQLELTGKTALITGSSRGIGLAIAAALHAEGCRVALNGRDTAKLAEACAQLHGSKAIAGDVSAPDEAERVVTEAVAALGKLDVLVCNVGSGASVPPGQQTVAEWRRVFTLNFYGTTNTVEAAIGALAATKGVIVCISSICGNEVVPGAPVTYSAAKASLNAYVNGMAAPLGEMGVRINAVAPGNVLFPGSSWERKLAERREFFEQYVRREVPLRRFGHPEEIADAVLFLVSQRASFITGACLVVDGGQTRSI